MLIAFFYLDLQNAWFCWLYPLQLARDLANEIPFLFELTRSYLIFICLCHAFWFNFVFLTPQIFPLLFIINSRQGLLGELILLQQQIQQHEEEARRAAGFSSQQKRKVMAQGTMCSAFTLIKYFSSLHLSQKNLTNYIVDANNWPTSLHMCSPVCLTKLYLKHDVKSKTGILCHFEIV